jgi:hypothetical protein
LGEEVGKALRSTSVWQGLVGTLLSDEMREGAALAELESTAGGANRRICLINMLINHLNILVTVYSLEK